MGILKTLMEKYGISVREARRRIMKAAVEAYKAILAELGLEKGNRALHRTVMKTVLPLVWKVIREEQRFPASDEVLRQLKYMKPDFVGSLRRLVVKV